MEVEIVLSVLKWYYSEKKNKRKIQLKGVGETKRESEYNLVEPAKIILWQTYRRALNFFIIFKYTTTNIHISIYSIAKFCFLKQLHKKIFQRKIE